MSGRRPAARPPVRVVIVMGVSGSGKTTVGIALARRLGWAFEDADAHHTPDNIEKMQAGIPLTDLDRQPWLTALAALVRRAVEADEPLVLACSALKRRYRTTLGAPGRAVRFVYLRVAADVVEHRLRHRIAHFMPASLLASQLQTFEEPAGEDNVVTVDAQHGVDAAVDEALRELGIAPR